MYFLLYLIWILLNGRLTAETCLLGVAVVALLALAGYALTGYTPRTEWRVLRKVPLFAAYLAVLLWEILKANFTVLSILLHKERRLEQSLVTFRVPLKTELARYILANSITLTPGTITVSAQQDCFTVHCLSHEMADGLENGVFVRLLRRLEA